MNSFYEKYRISQISIILIILTFTSCDIVSVKNDPMDCLNKSYENQIYLLEEYEKILLENNLLKDISGRSYKNFASDILNRKVPLDSIIRKFENSVNIDYINIQFENCINNSTEVRKRKKISKRENSNELNLLLDSLNEVLKFQPIEYFGQRWVQLKCLQGLQNVASKRELGSYLTINIDVNEKEVLIENSKVEMKDIEARLLQEKNNIIKKLGKRYQDQIVISLRVDGNVKMGTVQDIKTIIRNCNK